MSAIRANPQMIEVKTTWYPEDNKRILIDMNTETVGSLIKKIRNAVQRSLTGLTITAVKDGFHRFDLAVIEKSVLLKDLLRSTKVISIDAYLPVDYFG
ncbi:MAG: hypothetical protein K1X28_07515 [Parachlamydiales bacterium]|nr:hypothetical protein [Parachlamydiales bacterium]